MVCAVLSMPLQALKDLQKDMEAAGPRLHCCIVFSATLAGMSFSMLPSCRSPLTCGAMMRQPRPLLQFRQPRMPRAAQPGTMRATY